jgi:hypothetical protein
MKRLVLIYVLLLSACVGSNELAPAPCEHHQIEGLTCESIRPWEIYEKTITHNITLGSDQNKEFWFDSKDECEEWVKRLLKEHSENQRPLHCGTYHKDKFLHIYSDGIVEKENVYYRVDHLMKDNPNCKFGECYANGHSDFLGFTFLFTSKSAYEKFKKNPGKGLTKTTIDLFHDSEVDKIEVARPH